MGDANTTKRSGLAFWAPLIAAGLALFIVVVDSTMMNVAVPTIVKDLKTNVSAVQGVISLYSLIMASLMLVGGKLGGIHGVKRIFIVGVLIYGAGTLVAAISWNIAVLALGWSLLEGVGAAMVLPLAYALLVTNYEPREQAIGFGVLGGVSASAAAVGPILGGVLTSFFTWRLGFAGEVLIALAILPFSRYILERKTAEAGAAIDWGGAVFSFFGLFSLVLVLIMAGRYGWWNAKRPFVIGGTEIDLLGLSPTPLLIGLGLILLAAFVHWQMRRERRGQTPLVRLRVLANGTFLTGVTANIFQSMVITGLLFVLPLYLQAAVGYSAFQSGLAILPFSIATFVVSLGSAGLGQRIAPKFLIQTGVALLVVGAFLLYRVITLQITIPQMIIPLGVFGVGMGLLIAHLVNLILSSVAPDDSPEASGLNNALDQLGNSLGTAVVGSLLMAFFFGNVVTAALSDLGIESTPQERARIVVILEDARETFTEAERAQILELLPDAARQWLSRTADQAIVTAMQDVLVVIVGLLLVMFLLSTFLPRDKKRDVPPDERTP
ncbi:MAG TPA: MFS transporter [Anaerolineae bacterium]|nr:MFS transporter [Anaerolineae bacterium]